MGRDALVRLPTRSAGVLEAGMRRIVVLALLLVQLPAVVGCAGTKIEVDGIRVVEALWAEVDAELRRRAAFDLECPPAEITLTLFHLADGQPVEVGASGCDRRAVYSRPNVVGYVSGNWLRQECALPTAE